MIYYRIECGVAGEDSDWNYRFESLGMYYHYSSKEKSVNELKQIVYQKVLDREDLFYEEDFFKIKDLILSEIIKSNSPIEEVKL
mgnify:CR=1 FL=1